MGRGGGMFVWRRKRTIKMSSTGKVDKRVFKVEWFKVALLICNLVKSGGGGHVNQKRCADVSASGQLPYHHALLPNATTAYAPMVTHA